MPFFQFLRSAILMHIPILTMVQKRTTQWLKKWSCFAKKCESNLYANCLFYILSFCLKCFIFHFFSCGIHTHIPILAGVQNGRISGYKNGHILLKNEPLKLHLQEEGHLHANCLFYILSFYPKFALSQFFSRKIRMHIPILRGVQNGCWMHQSPKTVIFC